MKNKILAGILLIFICTFCGIIAGAIPVPIIVRAICILLFGILMLGVLYKACLELLEL